MQNLKVVEVMDRAPLEIGHETNILEARDLMKRHKTRHVLVRGANNQIVGLVAEADVLETGPSGSAALSVWELNYLLARTKVTDFMTKREEFVTIGPDKGLDAAAALMHEHGISALPVVEGAKVVGLLTATHLLRLVADQAL